jgi:hypothetical protein
MDNFLPIPASTSYSYRELPSTVSSTQHSWPGPDSRHPSSPSLGYDSLYPDLAPSPPSQSSSPPDHMNHSFDGMVPQAPESVGRRTPPNGSVSKKHMQSSPDWSHLSPHERSRRESKQRERNALNEIEAILQANNIFVRGAPKQLHAFLELYR